MGTVLFFLNRKPGTMKYRKGLKNRTVPYLNEDLALENL